MIKYYTMEHRGGLNEALETKKPITENKFYELARKFHYEPYCYDKRINCIRFIITNMEKNYDKPTWLLIEII